MAAREETPFPFDVVVALDSDQDRVRGYLEEYFRAHHNPNDGYTGRFFEQFCSHSNPYQFTAHDLLAVSALSVTIPPAAAWAILLDPTTSSSLNGLLAQVPPPGTNLADADADVIADDAPLSELYRALRRLPGMGPTRTSKLLAAKRPGLVPIRDSVVASLLQAGERWWVPMRHLVRIPRLRDAINVASTNVVPADVTLLRRLDVILWRWGTDAGIAPPTEDDADL